MKMKKIITPLMCIFILLSNICFSFAHSGRTDSAGGHTDNSTGIYHFHHGESAHYHNNDSSFDTTYNEPTTFERMYAELFKEELLSMKENKDIEKEKIEVWDFIFALALGVGTVIILYKLLYKPYRNYLANKSKYNIRSYKEFPLDIFERNGLLVGKNGEIILAGKSKPQLKFHGIHIFEHLFFNKPEPMLLSISGIGFIIFLIFHTIDQFINIEFTWITPIYAIAVFLSKILFLGFILFMPVALVITMIPLFTEIMFPKKYKRCKEYLESLNNYNKELSDKLNSLNYHTDK